MEVQNMYDGCQGRTNGDGTWRNNPGTPGGEQRQAAEANWWSLNYVTRQYIIWG